MTTVIFEDDSPQAKQLLEYIKTLPFATVIEKKSFQEAVEDTDAVTVDEFFDELDDNIRKRFDQDIILQDMAHTSVLTR